MSSPDQTQHLLQKCDRELADLKVTLDNYKSAHRQIAETLVQKQDNDDLKRTSAAMCIKIQHIEERIMHQEATQSSLLRVYATRLALDEGHAEISAYAESQPPVLAEIITRLITKPDLVDMIIDSRAERFTRDCKMRGLLRANIFYWSDTIKSCWPAIIGLGRWALAGELFRRWLGS